MRKPVVNYLLALSIVACLFLGSQLYQRDMALNRSTWGYAGTNLWKHINWAGLSLSPGSDGRIAPDLNGIAQALEDLEAIQYLPFYAQRVNSADVATLRQFLRYAQRAHALALKEQGDTGKVSPGSIARLQKIQEGLGAVLRGNERTNQLTNGRNPWNHAAWRAMWREIAESLRQIDFVPLPD